MKKPKVLVLTGFGINCDYETQFAFNLPQVGGEAQRVHVNDLLVQRGFLKKFHILALPGGFSYGDDIASGKVLANKLRYNLEEEMREFVEAGKLIIGICNGFQVLVKMGLLPAMDGELFSQKATLTFNDSGKFEDRWVYMKGNPLSPCIFTKGIDMLYLPVRHGEGKFIPQDSQVLERLKEGQQVVLQYTDEAGQLAGYPYNPNGSIANIAGICNPEGTVFGLMPHPEAYLFKINHPRWTREELPEEGMGVAVFRNAVEYARSVSE